MTDAVEAVARALATADGVSETFFDQPGAVESWQTYCASARAAIAAHKAALLEAGMVIVPREPTEAVVSAFALGLWGPDPKAPFDTTAQYAANVWRLMIAAALGETEDMTDG